MPELKALGSMESSGVNTSAEVETEPEYPDLEREIRKLKEFGKPLKEEVIVTPLMPLISKIMRLPDELGGMPKKAVEIIEREVGECERLLEEMSYEYVRRIITKPEPSKVFKILENSNIFERELRKRMGKKLSLDSGHEIELTAEIIDCLTRYRFSLGTPPVTPNGIQTIEKILFGGDLHDIYGFREILGGNKAMFDRFLAAVDKLIEQSTHYTKAGEQKEFEKEATEFSNLEGLRGFKKSTITGTADTAIRLISEHMFSQHRNGSRPIRGLDRAYSLDEELRKDMVANKEAIFIVRVSSVPHNIFTRDELHPEWKGIIGRLILVDDSDNARKSGCTFVYSLNPLVKKTLDKFHVKDSGTPANTQMNLRSILENFKDRDMVELRENIDKKIADIMSTGVHEMNAAKVRGKRWLVTMQRDYLSLKNFRMFLDFIIVIKNSDEESLAEINKSLQETTASQGMDYFFKALKGKGYDCIPVPQGGGRREIGHIGKFHLLKTQRNLEIFREQKLAECRRKLIEHKSKGEISAISTDAETNALERALMQNQSPDHSINTRQEADILTIAISTGVQGILHTGVQKLEEGIESIRGRIEELTSSNVPGDIKAGVELGLRKLGLGAGGKMFERGRFRDTANKLRFGLGMLQESANGVLDYAEEKIKDGKRKLEVRSLDFAEKMLNDIEREAFQPALALSEVGWTFNDVLNENDFPPKNYIEIKMDDKGVLDPSSLEDQLESIRENLHHFPELFELYCSGIILIINDPHNPTSTVAPNKVKLKLLDIASKYNLTVLSDEAYRKQVATKIKRRQGDSSLSEFYEQNRKRFTNPITIYTALPTTKWAIGAGRRTGVIVSNDRAKGVNGETFSTFVEENTDSVNNIALLMDMEAYKTGLMVKKVCKALEPAVFGSIGKDPIATIDSILEEEFSDLTAKDFVATVYFALIEARNKLDLLKKRGAGPLDYSKYVNGVISNLKNLRLDKQTQRDGIERSEAALEAIQRVSQDYPDLRQNYIPPEGPFYFCIKLDSEDNDISLQAFLQEIAKARKIDVVPTAKGYVRFSFGGIVDGTPKGYELLGLAIETDLRILLEYWAKFKNKREELHDAHDLNPELNALKAIFPGGEIELVRTYQDKMVLVDALRNYKEHGRKKPAHIRPANVEEYITTIEPDSKVHIVTIKKVQCGNIDEFIGSKPFKDLFNNYLLQIRTKISQVQHLNEKDTIAYYGARQFEGKFKSRTFKDGEKKIFAQIAIEISKIWFSNDTIKILSESYGDTSPKNQRSALMGTEKDLSEYIKTFLRVFLTEEQEKEIDFRPTFQAGYSIINNVNAHKGLPKWLKSLIEKSEFVGQSVPTDPSPEMITGGTARIAGEDRGIFRRDDNEDDSPDSAFFRDNLEKFVEVMNPRDYVCKMVQVGGTRVLLIMNRAYSHYLAEELRLFPQFDLKADDTKKLKPDAVSFLGLPTKVMGEDYRIGYFFDRRQDDSAIPVSWVDAENITDYMGYLKKPILTVANEIVKEKGMMPIHGSAVTLILKNGLRKTIVMGGDSGTGKSETIIAMIEQIIKGLDAAEEVQSVELLAGDMLSLFEGDDRQLYMLGTEQGDFMRTTDIPADWQERFRDLIEGGSKTNLVPGNPNSRITIRGICDPEIFLRPVRVNMFFNINNFETPPGGSFRETEDPANLLLQEYVKGYRGEKGTSGDQPNIFAGVFFSDNPDKNAILERYGEELDKLLGWEVIKDERGKAANAILKFNDVDSGIFRAKAMVSSLFVGKKIKVETEEHEIIDTKYDINNNHFLVAIRNEDGIIFERKLTRNEIFNEIYNPIASTYCGNPFVYPKGMDEVLARFAEVMKEEDVITGTLYTQLRIPGMEYEGPARASQSIIEFILKDPRINERFQRHKRKVSKSVRKKYGTAIIGPEEIPIEIEAFNLLLLERHESDTIRPIDAERNTIELRTPYYEYDPKAKKRKFNPSLITMEIKGAISNICENEEYKQINLDGYEFDLEQYRCVKSWDSKEELIFQILLVNGIIRLGYEDNVFDRHISEVKKAEKIAEEIITGKKEALIESEVLMPSLYQVRTYFQNQ